MNWRVLVCMVVMGVVVALATVTVGAAAQSGSALLSARPARPAPGQPVRIELSNGSGDRLSFKGKWLVENRKGDIVAAKRWSDRTLRSGEVRTWEWDQKSAAGVAVPAGRYRAVVDTSAGKRRAGFTIGDYFVLGFRHYQEAEFVVFVAVQKELEVMRAELDEPEAERNLITSGIVRKPARYNPAWSYSMAPPTIATGEVFMEVCDANPYYVEDNRSAWMGDRWCPWDSYIKRSGP